MKSTTGALIVAAGILTLILLAPPASLAALPADPAAQVQSLPRNASAHWVWVNDFVFPHMSSGKALLVDGDSGRFLGQLDTGFGSMRVVLSPDGQTIYSPEVYFSRGTRGQRTDVVTLYDPSHLNPLAEIAIPPKRSSNMPMMSNAELTDDGRFLLVYNFNWMIDNLSSSPKPLQFRRLTAAEVAGYRRTPLMSVAPVRAKLVAALPTSQGQ